MTFKILSWIIGERFNLTHPEDPVQRLPVAYLRTIVRNLFVYCLVMQPALQSELEIVQSRKFMCFRSLPLILLSHILKIIQFFDDSEGTF